MIITGRITSLHPQRHTPNGNPIYIITVVSNQETVTGITAPDHTIGYAVSVGLEGTFDYYGTSPRATFTGVSKKEDEFEV